MYEADERWHSGEKKKEGGQQLDATENGNVMAAVFGRGRMNR